jgi:hypothetical protein
MREFNPLQYDIYRVTKMSQILFFDSIIFHDKCQIY